MPTRAPANPPTVPPNAAPLSAAIIGPAAMKGPTPGMARAPIPTSQPNPAPTATPATAPSGALVFFSCAKFFVLPLSGKSTEMSFEENPAALRSATIRSACSTRDAMQKTALDVLFLLYKSVSITFEDAASITTD